MLLCAACEVRLVKLSKRSHALIFFLFMRFGDDFCLFWLSFMIPKPGEVTEIYKSDHIWQNLGKVMLSYITQVLLSYDNINSY